jgi:hypothetical protein
MTIQTLFGNRLSNLYLPTDNPGLLGWWEGDDPNGNGILPANGAAISTWYDKSGLGHHLTQAIVANQPTFDANSLNGRGTIRYANTDKRLMTPQFYDSDVVFTATVVSKLDSVTDLPNQHIWYVGNTGAPNGYGYVINLFGDTTRDIFIGSDILSDGYATDQWEIVTICYDGNGFYAMCVNGVFQDVSEPGTPPEPPTDDFNVGVIITGNIAGLIFRNAVPHDSLILADQQYFARKWGIAV